MKRLDIIRGELIGKETIVDGDITGKIIDETKHLIVLDTKKGFKKFKKRGHVFEIKFQGMSFKIKGDELAFKPEERIKIT
tara:strand:- start:14557 stop:14796 length:240 start_codon:yes stop_codon:yes gene_type:complete